MPLHDTSKFMSMPTSPTMFSKINCEGKADYWYNRYFSAFSLEKRPWKFMTSGYSIESIAGTGSQAVVLNKGIGAEYNLKYMWMNKRR